MEDTDLCYRAWKKGYNLNDIINSIPSDQDFSIAERLVAIVAFLSL